jgi:hypothetical protein
MRRTLVLQLFVLGIGISAAFACYEGPTVPAEAPIVKRLSRFSDCTDHNRVGTARGPRATFGEGCDEEPQNYDGRELNSFESQSLNDIISLLNNAITQHGYSECDDLVSTFGYITVLAFDDTVWMSSGNALGGYWNPDDGHVVLWAQSQNWDHNFIHELAHAALQHPVPQSQEQRDAQHSAIELTYGRCLAMI